MVPNIAYMWCTKRLINGLDRIGLRVQISLLSSPSRVEVGRQGASPTGGRGSRKDTQPLDQGFPNWWARPHLRARGFSMWARDFEKYSNF